jgi:hypothetical protein
VFLYVSINSIGAHPPPPHHLSDIFNCTCSQSRAFAFYWLAPGWGICSGPKSWIFACFANFSHILVCNACMFTHLCILWINHGGHTHFRLFSCPYCWYIDFCSLILLYFNILIKNVLKQNCHRIDFKYRYFWYEIEPAFDFLVQKSSEKFCPQGWGIWVNVSPQGWGFCCIIESILTWFIGTADAWSRNEVEKKSSQIWIFPMDHLHYRINFDLDKNFITAWKSITKLVIFQSFVAKCCKMWII